MHVVYCIKIKRRIIMKEVKDMDIGEYMLRLTAPIIGLGAGAGFAFAGLDLAGIDNSWLVPATIVPCAVAGAYAGCVAAVDGFSKKLSKVITGAFIVGFGLMINSGVIQPAIQSNAAAQAETTQEICTCKAVDN